MIQFIVETPPPNRGISRKEMMRQLVAYAGEEMRNRGLEAAARLLERMPSYDQGGRRLVAADAAASMIQRLKRDPRLQMTDWWNPQHTRENPQPTADENWG